MVWFVNRGAFYEITVEDKLLYMLQETTSKIKNSIWSSVEGDKKKKEIEKERQKGILPERYAKFAMNI